MSLRSGIAFALLFGTLAVPQDAAAWCRTTTDGQFEPTAQIPCDLDGTPLWWATRCVDLVVNRRASAQVDLETARAVVSESFASWSAADCPADPVACVGNGAGQPSITVREVGPTDCGAGFERGGSNANVVVFYDGGWPHEDAQSTLALTTVTYRTDDGRILDADIEVNSDRDIFFYTAAEPLQSEYDLRSILTHEAGHFLGLAHTQPQNTDATMASRYVAGTTFMRSLSADDVCGICAAAPPDRDVVCNPQTPGACLDGAAGPMDTDEGGGCSVSLARPSGAGSALVGIAALVAFARLRRRR